MIRERFGRERNAVNLLRKAEYGGRVALSIPQLNGFFF